MNSAVSLDPLQIVGQEQTPLLRKAGKPELSCIFCDRIKAFSSIIALWSHFVHQHSKSSNRPYAKVILGQHLLGEIRRTALLWREYWLHYSNGGKRGNPTMAKLDQVAREDFTWATVLSWNLR
jgi:hypothetical protein